MMTIILSVICVLIASAAIVGLCSTEDYTDYLKEMQAKEYHE